MCFGMQLTQYLEEGHLQDFLLPSRNSDIFTGLPAFVNDTNRPVNFALTIKSGKFTQGTNPLQLQYTNTTLWCGDNRNAAAPMIANAMELASGSEGQVLEASVTQNLPSEGPTEAGMLLHS